LWVIENQTGTKVAERRFAVFALRQSFVAKSKGYFFSFNEPHNSAYAKHKFNERIKAAVTHGCCNGIENAANNFATAEGVDSKVHIYFRIKVKLSFYPCGVEHPIAIRKIAISNKFPKQIGLKNTDCSF
jgi:hypothetical protein